MKPLALTPLITLCWSLAVPAHHWVVDEYDEAGRFTVEIVVEEFRFIYPHPLIIARIPDSRANPFTADAGEDQLWTLEMDNRRELADLGWDEDTFESGDRILVTVDPSPYKSHALYVRALEHPVDGYRYEHNVRRLFYN